MNLLLLNVLFIIIYRAPLLLLAPLAFALAEFDVPFVLLLVVLVPVAGSSGGNFSLASNAYTQK